MVRILLVEDSVVQREILRRILVGDPTFSIVGEARNGREAVRLVQELAPDVVLMDIHMPDMDGVEATREIMRRCPVPIVIASATLKKHDIDLGLEALHAGACAVIAKPEGAVLLHMEKMAGKLREQLLAASRVRLRPATPRGESSSPADQRQLIRSIKIDQTIDVIGICGSTGAPPVLIDILAALPRPFAVPILLVQHITPGFEENFSRWLSERSGQRAHLAEDGQRLEPGVWLAPAGVHLTVKSPWTVSLVTRSPADIHCPSGNPLFASLARHVGSHAAGVLLTGMGDDGADGLLKLKQAGGLTIVQDEASSFIWGMPKAGKERGAATFELNPREIALALAQTNR